jgi:hypothetical protein
MGCVGINKLSRPTAKGKAPRGGSPELLVLFRCRRRYNTSCKTIAFLMPWNIMQQRGPFLRGKRGSRWPRWLRYFSEPE